MFVVFDRTLAAGVDFAASASALSVLEVWSVLRVNYQGIVSEGKSR